MSQKKVNKIIKNKTVEIEGRTISGEPRKYTFNLMTARTAFQVMHEFTAECQIISPMLAEAAAKEPSDESEEFTAADIPTEILEQIISFMPMTITWSRLVTLNKEMLAGATIEIGDETVELNKDGFGEINTHEAYTALLFAAWANYEDLLYPLFSALEKQGEDDIDQDKEKKMEPLPE